MPKTSNSPPIGAPTWLGAYPDSGSQDFFGFQFLRQTNRAVVLNNGAANEFRTSKPLLYYPAVILAFREEHKLEPDAPLPSNLQDQWVKWFQTAHYLFTVGNLLIRNELPDRGFTGAIKEINTVGEPLQNANSAFSIWGRLQTYFGTRRYGYLQQYWTSPLGYYHAVSNIGACRPGAYAVDAFKLFSKNPNWPILLGVLRQGTVKPSQLPKVAPLIDVKSLSPDEVSLIQTMIFDKQNLHEEQATVYRDSYQQLVRLLAEYPIKQNSGLNNGYEVLAVYLLRYLKRLAPYNSLELSWRVLCSSYPYEIGLVRLFCRLMTIGGNVLSYQALNSTIAADIKSWLKRRKLKDQPLSEMAAQMLDSLTTPGDIVAALDDNDSENDDAWVGGLLFGYLAYYIDSLERTTQDIHGYDSLTDEYYAFNPQHAFKFLQGKSGSFSELLQLAAFQSLQNQFEFAMRRMEYGQNAKFLAIPYPDLKRVEFQVSDDYVNAKEGIIGFLDCTLSFWRSANLLTVDRNTRIVGTKEASLE